MLGVNHIAKWDAAANSWSGFGSGVDSDVLALASGPNTIYAGGVFTTAGGQESDYFARWALFPLYLPAMIR